jgi:heme-degrading monooxygenase HmoA
MSDEMLALARSMPGSGFVGLRTYESADGERLAIVWWRDRESLENWRHDVRHRLAQQLGRERWYSFYEIEVAEVIRHHRFERDPQDTATIADSRGVQDGYDQRC